MKELKNSEELVDSDPRDKAQGLGSCTVEIYEEVMEERYGYVKKIILRVRGSGS